MHPSSCCVTTLHLHSLILFLLLIIVTSPCCQAFGTFATKRSGSGQIPSSGRPGSILRVYDETMALLSNDKDKEGGPDAGSNAAEILDQFRIGYLSDVEGHWDYFLGVIYA